jgi:voltage-gated potassium channel
VRNAARVIVTSTVAVVIVSAAAVRIFDPHDFPTYGLSLWWALQTVTTVGYGDITPTTDVGRIVGGIAMLEGIAFLAVVTAGITSIFVARAQREIHGGEEPDSDVMVALADVTARLERIEQTLRRPPDDHPVRTMPGPADGA